MDTHGKKRSKAFRDHIVALKDHIRKTEEFLTEELETVAPKIKKLRESLNQ